MHLAQAQKFRNLLFKIWIFDSEANKSRQGVLLIYRQNINPLSAKYFVKWQLSKSLFIYNLYL